MNVYDAQGLLQVKQDVRGTGFALSLTKSLCSVVPIDWGINSISECGWDTHIYLPLSKLLMLKIDETPNLVSVYLVMRNDFCFKSKTR